MSKRLGLFEILATSAAVLIARSLPRTARFGKKKQVPEKSLEAGHELRDFNVRALTFLFLGIAVCAVILHVGLGLMFFWWRGIIQRKQYSRSAWHDVRQIPPPPQLEINSHGDLEDLLHHEREKLHSYSWVDKKSGLVSIPIREAEKRWLSAHQSKSKAKEENNE